MEDVARSIWLARDAAARAAVAGKAAGDAAAAAAIAAPVRGAATLAAISPDAADAEEATWGPLAGVGPLEEDAAAWEIVPEAAWPTYGRAADAAAE